MKKGRASGVTRPEPTIYGNCDSWASIVGKKGADLSLVTGKTQALQTHNEILFTSYQQKICNLKMQPQTVQEWRKPLFEINALARTTLPRHMTSGRETRRRFYQIVYLN